MFGFNLGFYKPADRYIVEKDVETILKKIVGQHMFFPDAVADKLLKKGEAGIYTIHGYCAVSTKYNQIEERPQIDSLHLATQVSEKYTGALLLSDIVLKVKGDSEWFEICKGPTEIDPAYWNLNLGEDIPRKVTLDEGITAIETAIKK